MQSVISRTLLISLGVALAGHAAVIDYSLTVLATNSTDPQLINPWGIGASATSPMWLGVNGSGVSEIYTGAGVKNTGLIVTIPGDGSVTGVVSNSTSDFDGDAFLFVSEDGTVSGWKSSLGTAAETLQTASDSNVYKGLTLETNGGFNYALLANFRAGTIDVIKGTASDPSLTGNFTDPALPSGYAPFDVEDINGVVYVAYAVQDPDKHDEVDGLGLGIVDAFNTNGTLIGRLVSNGGLLDAPWGMAIAPSGFGNVGGDLLVGNFGNGQINAYNASTGAFVATLDGTSGNPLAIDGLWALHFGTGTANGGGAQSLYVTAGPDGETGGAFDVIQAVPEPNTLLLAGLGLVAVGVWRRYFR